jgi:putative CocE/NonD family hydrolase
MALPRPGLRAGLLGLVVLGTLAATALTTAGTASAATGLRFVDIAGADGVVLKANVVEPTTAGRHPAIVFISSWGLNDDEYLVEANTLAGRGYTVLSYTPRGWWDSGGRIEVAGPKDVADLSAVLDWLVSHTTADPAHIGAAGVSYGSGIALIASASDPRIQAIAAMSTWADLGESLYGNQTRRPQAVWLLKTLADLFGRPSDEMRTIIDDYFANRNVDRITSWARVRSAASYLDQINGNHPAIFLANSYGDSLFPPNQLVDFYNRLTGPKHLEFAPGDHGLVEAGGLVGLPNHLFDSMGRWFDRYLAGSGATAEPPVVLRRLGSDTAEGYPDWAHVAGTTARYGLGAVPWWSGTGPLTTAVPPTGWSRTIWAGIDTTADAGVAVLSNGFTTLTGIPPTVWLPSVNRLNAAVWESDSLPDGAAIRGTGALHLAFGGSPSQGTVVAYLYDTDVRGTGRLITQVPATWLAPAADLDIRLPAVAYDVPAGHHLALVVDTKDPLYFDADVLAAPLTFTGASWLDVPIR